MTQAYSNPARENDAYSLPDVEVFYNDGVELTNEDGNPLPSGWYWWSCFPGCMPDSEPNGPYDTEAEALEDAQDSDS